MSFVIADDYQLQLDPDQGIKIHKCIQIIKVWIVFDILFSFIGGNGVPQIAIFINNLQLGKNQLNGTCLHFFLLH